MSISEEVLKKADMTADDLLLEIAIYLFDTERLSFGQAKSLSQLDHLSFQKELAKRDIYMKYDVEDLELDRKNLQQLRNKNFR
ncbi:MAG: UPF0175 family protein [Bacteroidota bacterium]